LSSQRTTTHRSQPPSVGAVSGAVARVPGSRPSTSQTLPGRFRPVKPEPPGLSCFADGIGTPTGTAGPPLGSSGFGRPAAGGFIRRARPVPCRARKLHRRVAYAKSGSPSRDSRLISTEISDLLPSALPRRGQAGRHPSPPCQPDRGPGVTAEGVGRGPGRIQPPDPGRTGGRVLRRIWGILPASARRVRQARCRRGWRRCG